MARPDQDIPLGHNHNTDGCILVLGGAGSGDVDMTHKRFSFLLLSIICLLVLLLLLSGCVTPQPWTDRNKVMAGVFITSTAADMASTSYSIERGGVEMNPLLGRYPSDGTLAIFGVLTAAAMIGVVHFLPAESRDWALGVASFIHFGAATYNFAQYRW